MINLREYQSEIVAGVRGSFATGHRATCVVSPTGSGKTVIFAHIANGVQRKQKRAMILVHRAELIRQTSETLDSLDVKHGIIAAGKITGGHHHIQVASVQTVVRRLSDYRPDLIIIDECHHAAAGSWRKVIDAYPDAKILGVTATPQRLDGKGLSGVFTDMILGPSVSDLIESGHLCRPAYYCPPIGANVAELHTRAGDFAKDEASEMMDKPKLVGDAVAHYRRIIQGAPTISFVTSLAHGQHVVDAYQAEGYAAAMIDGTMAPEDRRRVVEDLGNGSLNVLVSCEIVSEGFDVPRVVGAQFLRPTKSLALHLQQGGRVLRPFPGKERAVILDHVGNVAGRDDSLGLLEQPREWTLEGRKKGKSGDRTPPARQCEFCYHVHTPAPKCAECGYEYPVSMRQIEEVEGDLVEIDPKVEAARKQDERKKARTLDDLIGLARSRNYKNPLAWAHHVHSGRQSKRRKSA